MVPDLNHVELANAYNTFPSKHLASTKSVAPKGCLACPELFATVVGMTGTLRDASRTGENPSGPPGFQHSHFGFLKKNFRLPLKTGLTNIHLEAV